MTKAFNLLHQIALLEKAPPAASPVTEMVVQLLTDNLDVEEMRGKRNADFDATQFIQIRVKPLEKGTELSEILAAITKLLKSAKGKKLKITDVLQNEKSLHSAKYSSISCNALGIDYDIVVAAGANKGESFEKDLLIKMDNLVSQIDDSDEAKNAFAALSKIDPEFKLSNVVRVTARSGSTKRSGDMTPEETGKIIADIIVELKKGGKKYISVKNKNGSTVAQFGVAAAFTPDLKVNQASTEWKTMLKPFGLDATKIEQGLIAARDGTELDWDDIVPVSQKVSKTSPIFKIMEKMWGLDYYYLREITGGFKAMKIDRDTLQETILKNLRITEIRYPSKDRKQITVYIQSDKFAFKLEVRNPRGKGDVVPKQIQLAIAREIK